ncbi:N-acetyltransferase [Deinococcus maricopensis]|uniref:GNAT family acetyltransferase, putative n=1 Tax=Deinococcus maricopensis (strain DSM 21211 / LMG 22137 / NRRL B-23946 / LB-34) TaxID=709986 RepID=E8U5R6_DEIML|nr:N-acetyltransferase [Deinococcus maricopensis]ADV66405.1 GNAT family acetyltransferase, putative [Deinococcus maricopensis DSM 21211]
MLLSDADTAAHLEAAQARSLLAQGRAARTLHPAALITTLSVPGGAALFTRAAWTRKLNHATTITLNPDTLRTLQEAAARHGVPLDVDVPTHAPAGTLTVLADAGFRMVAAQHVYAADLRTWTAPDTPRHAQAVAVPPDLHAAFVDASVAGFHAQPNPRDPDLLALLARIALTRVDVTPFAVLDGARVLGTAALAHLGDVAHLHLGSTTPTARARGVQTALLHARLTHARAAGATLAVMSARPGTASARNAERAGLHLAYARLTWRAGTPRP